MYLQIQSIQTLIITQHGFLPEFSLFKYPSLYLDKLERLRPDLDQHESIVTLCESGIKSPMTYLRKRARLRDYKYISLLKEKNVAT